MLCLLCLPFLLKGNFGHGLFTMTILMLTYFLPAAIGYGVWGELELVKRTFFNMRSDFFFYEGKVFYFVLFSGLIYLTTYIGVYFYFFDGLKQFSYTEPAVSDFTNLCKHLIWIPICTCIVGCTVSAFFFSLYYQGGYFQLFYWIGVFLPLVSLPIYVYYFGVEKRLVLLLLMMTAFLIFEQRFTAAMTIIYFLLAATFRWKIKSPTKIIVFGSIIFAIVIGYKWVEMVLIDGSDHFNLLDIFYFDVGRIWIISWVFGRDLISDLQPVYGPLIPFYCEFINPCLQFSYLLELSTNPGGNPQDKQGGLGVSGLGELWLVFGMPGSFIYVMLVSTFHAFLDISIMKSDTKRSSILLLGGIPLVFFMNAHSLVSSTGLFVILIVTVFVILLNKLTLKAK